MSVVTLGGCTVQHTLFEQAPELRAGTSLDPWSSGGVLCQPDQATDHNGLHLSHDLALSTHNHSTAKGTVSQGLEDRGQRR